MPIPPADPGRAPAISVVSGFKPLPDTKVLDQSTFTLLVIVKYKFNKIIGHLSHAWVTSPHHSSVGRASDCRSVQTSECPWFDSECLAMSPQKLIRPSQSSFSEERKGRSGGRRGDDARETGGETERERGTHETGCTD
eukprot:2479345-Rhodomonas_salina.1